MRFSINSIALKFIFAIQEKGLELRRRSQVMSPPPADEAQAPTEEKKTPVKTTAEGELVVDLEAQADSEVRNMLQSPGRGGRRRSVFTDEAPQGEAGAGPSLVVDVARQLEDEGADIRTMLQSPGPQTRRRSQPQIEGVAALSVGIIEQLGQEQADIRTMLQSPNPNRRGSQPNLDVEIPGKVAEPVAESPELNIDLTQQFQNAADDDNVNSLTSLQSPGPARQKPNLSSENNSVSDIKLTSLNVEETLLAEGVNDIRTMLQSPKPVKATNLTTSSSSAASNDKRTSDSASAILDLGVIE